METSLIGRVADLAARVVLREGTVAAVSDPVEGFRRVEVDVAGVQWTAGQKVQFRVGGFDFRTYTPFAWTPRGVSFLVVRHGTGPAAAWVEALQAGQAVQMWGPRSAIDLSKVTAPPLFVGDETSFALTAAWTTEGRTPVAAQLYEVGAVDASRDALAQLGLDAVETALVARTAGDAHRTELAHRAVELVRADPGAPVVLTGNVRSIKSVRDALKAAGLGNPVRAKAHWDPNRKGLD